MDPVARGVTYADLLAMLEDPSERHELVDGERFVSPSPSVRHQRAVLACVRTLLRWTDQHGGEVFVSPTDVWFDDATVLVTDVCVVHPDDHDLLHDPRAIRVTPALVVEVSSPATRAHDRLRKRRVYERAGVATYWFVDLEDDVVEVYELTGSRYEEPTRVVAGQVTAGRLTGLAVEVASLLP